MNENDRHSPQRTDGEIDEAMWRMTRRSFGFGALSGILGGGVATWIANQRHEDGIPWFLRRILQFNERCASTLFDKDRLAPEFPRDRATEPRVNGMVGLQSPIDETNGMVHITGAADRHIPLHAIKQLPHHEMTTEFKCVEGWSRIVHWKGVRLADFLAKYGENTNYVGISTPPDRVDSRGRPDHYYVGLDQASAIHPQTLLCFEMNGQPLTPGHGAPLRLVSTVKYGYKCIKRLNMMELTNERPPDYWGKRGYDWYGGH